jgi:hypothetical protein
MSDAFKPVDLRAVGLVSALGTDWPTCCAAARAGLRRAAPIFGFEGQSALDGEDEPPIGHAASLVTHGFEADARLLRLLAAGLLDLVQRAPHLLEATHTTGVVLVLGAPWRHLGADALFDNAQCAAALLAERTRTAAAIQGKPASSSEPDEDDGPTPHSN